MSDTIPVIFYFDFSFDDDSTKTYGFAGNLEKNKIPSIHEIMEYVEEIYLDLENEFGVHDWSSSPDDRVICVGGYTTYEVELESAPKLMQRWKEELEKVADLGVQFGPVVEIAVESTDNDYDIYLKILEAQGK